MAEHRINLVDEGIELTATLEVPSRPVGIVAFAHGSGSSRLSPRNVEVAASLERRGCATLLFDLLTETEALDRRNVFDIPILGRRMLGATRWLMAQSVGHDLPIAYFGASTGAAAALVAAAELREAVSAVVSRGGRPDLAGDALPKVTAPTLLIVGSRDATVLDLNRQAQDQMTCPTRLDVIQGATHLFEEPGALQQVAEAAGGWFESRFRAS